GTLNGTIEEVDGSRVLQFTGGGSGPRARVFRLNESIAGDQINVNFDWNPGTIQSTPNEGTVSIQDSNGNNWLTLYAKATSAAIDYSILVDGSDRASTEVLNGQWVNVDIRIHAHPRTMDVTLTSKLDSSQATAISGLELPEHIA